MKTVTVLSFIGMFLLFYNNAYVFKVKKLLKLFFVALTRYKGENRVCMLTLKSAVPFSPTLKK